MKTQYKSILKIPLLFVLFCLTLSTTVAQVTPYPTIPCQYINSDFINTNDSINFQGNIIAPPNSSYTVDVSGSSNVDFKSGTEVVLNPGFTAEPNANGSFTAEIGPGFDCILIAPDPTDPTTIQSGVVNVKEWEKFEIGFKLPHDYTNAVDSFFTHYYSGNHHVNPLTDLNPYADDSLSVVVNLTSPSGRHIRKWGFFMRVANFLVEADHSDPFNEEKKQLAADTANPLYPYNWRFRFAPDETGSWSFNVIISNPQHVLPTYSFNDFAFVCAAPESTNHGFLMVNPTNKRSLQFTDGTPFFGIGENVAEPAHGWSDDLFWYNNYLGFYKLDFDNYMRTLHEMSSAGANYLGKHTCKLDFAIEWYNLGVYDAPFDTITPACTCVSRSRLHSPSNFKYSTPDSTTSLYTAYHPPSNLSINRQYSLWAFDRFFDTLRKDKIYMQITVEPFPTIVAYQNWMWGDNAYVIYSNDINGKTNPLKYYSDPKLRYYWKRRYKYIMDRWGYSVNLGVIESFGEIDQTLGFHTDSAKYLSNECCVDSCNWYGSDALRNTIYDWHSDIFGFLKDSLNNSDPHLTGANFTDAYVDYANTDTLKKYYRILRNPEVDIADIHRYIWNMSTNQFGGIYNLSRNKIFTILDTCVKPFHLGESDNFGGIPVTGLSDPPLTYYYFNNYDISLHNDLWFSAFTGNFSTGLPWGWNTIHWWPYSNPTSLQYDTLRYNSITSSYDTVKVTIPVDNILGDQQYPVLPLPGGIHTNFKNKKIYHNFKPLSDFIINNNIDFSQPYTPMRYDSTDNIESYYLVNSNKTIAYGWIHNLNHYWYNDYYYYYDDLTYDYERNACNPPNVDFGVFLSGFDAYKTYTINFFPTRLNVSTVPPYQTLFNNSGKLIIPANVFINYFGCDTSNADFAFIITDGSSLLRSNNTNVIKPNTDDFNVLISPNPSSGIFNITFIGLNNSSSKNEIFVYNSLGGLILHEINATNTPIDLSNQAKGLYYLKISINNTSKYFKLIHS